MYPKLKIILRSRHDAHEKHIACLTEWSIRHCIYSAVQRMLWTRAACTVHQFVCSSLPESDHGLSEVVGYHSDREVVEKEVVGVTFLEDGSQSV